MEIAMILVRNTTAYFKDEPNSYLGLPVFRNKDADDYWVLNPHTEIFEKFNGVIEPGMDPRGWSIFGQKLVDEWNEKNLPAEDYILN